MLCNGYDQTKGFICNMVVLQFFWDKNCWPKITLKEKYLWNIPVVVFNGSKSTQLQVEYNGECKIEKTSVHQRNCKSKIIFTISPMHSAAALNFWQVLTAMLLNCAEIGCKMQIAPISADVKKYSSKDELMFNYSG